MSNYLLVIFKDHIIYISKVIGVTRVDRNQIFRPDIYGSCSKTRMMHKWKTKD